MNRDHDMSAKSKNNLNFLQVHSGRIFILGNALASFGILLVTVGGSWDITNHLLSKPETFFSSPHALMYFGVLISLIGVALSFTGWRNLRSFRESYQVSLKIGMVGIALLAGAGPFDFVWHSNFGLDGLLSPPHFMLITGMFLCSIGSMVGISRYLKINSSGSVSAYMIILAVVPVWLSGSGILSSLSLPFSSTDFFLFNPDPVLAFFVASFGYPFLISISMFFAFRLSDFKFGAMSILGSLFLLVYSSTAIMPNFALYDSIQFYLLNLIPFVMSDIILRYDRSKISCVFAGGLIGSTFYMVYYPYVMYTFNEVLLGKIVSPSLIYFVYFELINKVFSLTVIPAIAMGIFASLLSEKISKKIQMQRS